MSLELDAGDDTELRDGPAHGRGRPNVSGDLPTLFRTGPMFARALAGYDRFQVDTYVQWAEEELAAAEREREHLVSRTVRTQADLDEARRLLGHSPAGGRLLETSGRIGALLAAAADEADDIRTEARAEASAAEARARLLLTRADETVTAAQAGAQRLVADATTAAAAVTAEAGRLLAEAAATRRGAAADAAALREEAQRIERRATEDAARAGRTAAAEAAAALDRARAEVVGMLTAGREQRRRADEQAAAERDRLDRTAAARRAALLVEVAQLELRRDVLRQDLGRVATAGGPSPERPGRPLRRLLDALAPHPRRVATP